MPNDAVPAGLGLAEGTGRYGSINDDYPPCPPSQGQPGGQGQGQAGQQPESPTQIANRFWREVPLPKPQPHIAPGRAITGKFAYLETRGRTTETYTRDTPLGRMVINATGTYHVDWGDGTKTGPHHDEGGAWPGGKIVHEYLRIGGYDVVVTERWTATWRLGDESGSLDELRTTGRINDFPVEQIQAVRFR